MSVEEVEHNATLPTIPPELPARPVALHAGTPYRKGPPERAEWQQAAVGDTNWPVRDPTRDSARDREMVARTAQNTKHAVAHNWYPPEFANEKGQVVFPVAQSNTIVDRSNTPADDVLPNDARARKAVPAGAVLDYFDSAIVEIAKALQDGNDQHNPGEPLHWSRGKSSDHAHCIIRHYLQRGKLSTSPTGAVIRHSTYMAIRALMLLQEELEAAGAPLSRGSKIFKPKE